MNTSTNTARLDYLDAVRAFALLLGIVFHDSAGIGFSVAYATMMWSLAFLAIGVFRKLFSRPNATLRYVADSSYWLYLVHLPIVIWLQIAVAELPWHWSVKLAAFAFATIGLSLMMYDLFVTRLGRRLRARRAGRRTSGGWRSAR